LFRQQVWQAADGDEAESVLAQTALSLRPWQAHVLGELELLLQPPPVKPASLQHAWHALALPAWPAQTVSPLSSRRSPQTQ